MRELLGKNGSESQEEIIPPPRKSRSKIRKDWNVDGEFILGKNWYMRRLKYNIIIDRLVHLRILCMCIHIHFLCKLILIDRLVHIIIVYVHTYALFVQPYITNIMHLHNKNLELRNLF